MIASGRNRRQNSVRTISTFSCDIAYSESPAASRASSGLAYICIRNPAVPDRPNHAEAHSTLDPGGLRAPPLVNMVTNRLPGVDVVLDLNCRSSHASAQSASNCLAPSIPG